MVASAAQRYRTPATLAGHRGPLDRRALSLSIAITAGMFAVILAISTGTSKLTEDKETLTLFSASTVSIPERERPEPQQDLLEPVRADTLEESAPQPSPATIAPSPDIAIVPVAEITLSPVILPAIDTAATSILPINGSISDGDRLSGPDGPPGTGGDGIAGSGPGGSGSGGGMRTDLTAVWAPRMDFAALDAYYPKAAAGSRRTGIAILKCMVLRSERVRDCSLVAESPRGLGFGRAALKAQEIYRVHVFDERKRRVYNEWVLINIRSNPKDEPKVEDDAAATQEALTPAP